MRKHIVTNTDSGSTAPAEPDVPAAVSGSATTAGRDVPRGAVIREGGVHPGGSTEALSGEAFRKAVKAAQSAKAKTQRQQRARPWSKRDPYAKAVPGGRKPPPPSGDAA
jgi:hypothetical protein